MKIRAGNHSVILQALALSLGTAVALALARFAYALLLPAMKADLKWSYALAGGMNAANAAGYLLGALVAVLMMTRTGTRRSFVGTLLLAGLALLFSGIFTNAFVLAALRLLAWGGGAVVFIAGGELASHLASAEGETGGRVPRPAPSWPCTSAAAGSASSYLDWVCPCCSRSVRPARGGGLRRGWVPPRYSRWPRQPGWFSVCRSPRKV